jgi:alkylhydroperoxidase family enzyme
MSYLTQLQTEDEAEKAQFYAQDTAKLGYVANYSWLLAHRPDVYRAWQQLNGAIKAVMEPRRYEVATLGAVRQLRSSYCGLAHGDVLARLTGEQPVIDIMTDLDNLDQADRAVVVLAEKVATAAADITGEDIQQARNAGLSDDDILNVVLAAAARCFFSKVLDGTGTQADSELRTKLPPSLIDVLVVGRPIEESESVARPMS